MKALTLWPEWAYAIAHLGKRTENRSWAPSLRVGECFAIHAGAHIGGRPGPRALLDGASSVASMLDTAGQAAWRLQVPGGSATGFREVCPTRAIVCTAVYLGWDEEQRTPWDIAGEKHWRLGDVRALGKPVAVQKGRLGLWDCTHLEAAIANALVVPA